MTGETILSKLLSGMKPVLDPQTFVFCTFANRSLADLASHDPIGLFMESEGATAILPLQTARELGADASAPFRRITLTVHSSLEAVGLTAAVSAALAQDGISANVVAAYYHDHVFVPESDAERALEVLTGLAEGVT